MTAADALGAASWAAREWLGRPGLEPGARADLVVYRSDPRADLSVLHEPALVMLRGRPVHAGRDRAADAEIAVAAPTGGGRRA